MVAQMGLRISEGFIILAISSLGEQNSIHVGIELKDIHVYENRCKNKNA